MNKYLEKPIHYLRSLDAFLWDNLMNIETSEVGVHRLSVASKFNDSIKYQPNSNYTIGRAIRLAELNKDDVVFVLGAAKGRAMSHFARMNIKKVVGIEISSELASIAEKNMARLRGKKTETVIWNMDVVSADLSEGSVFYMFNPFGQKTLNSVLTKFEKMKTVFNHPLKFIYINPVHMSEFDKIPWLAKVKDSTNILGNRIVIYSNYDF